MKNIKPIVILVFMGLNASVAAQVNSDVEEVDVLPGISELPVLNLSDISPKPIQKLEATDFLIRENSTQRTNDASIDDNIPTAQQDLIERLNYKQKEGSKIKRFKPEVRVSILNDDVESSWKD